jgi:hypothetical protein
VPFHVPAEPGLDRRPLVRVVVLETVDVRYGVSVRLQGNWRGLTMCVCHSTGQDHSRSQQPDRPS